MKRIATTMAAIAMLAASTVASAADDLWFSVQGALPAGVTAVGGGPGQTLAIEKTLAGPATVRVGINATSATGAFNVWELELFSSAGGAFANGTAHGAGYDQPASGAPNGTSSFFAGRGSSGSAGSTGLLYSFDLIIDGSNPNLGVTGDFHGVGFGFIMNNGLYWFGNVGENPLSYGAPNYVGADDVTPGWGSLPVITVTPEPTTLVLLGLGAVALLRRRK